MKIEQILDQYPVTSDVGHRDWMKHLPRECVALDLLSRSRIYPHFGYLDDIRAHHFMPETGAA